VLDVTLDARRLVHKLLGMQLMIETIALTIFAEIRESRIEPVLCDLLPYYEKDEARHVGLGVMYLPRLLRQLSRVETAGVVAFQLRSIAMLMSAGINMHDHFRNLGIDPRKMAEYTMKLQDDVTRDMLADAPSGHGHRRRDSVRGLLNPAAGFGPRILDFLHPRGGIAARPTWHRTTMRVWKRAAAAVDRALA
jgi:hypothetical protein